MKTTAFPDKTAQQSSDGLLPLSRSRSVRRSRGQQALLLNSGRVVLLVCVLLVWQFISGRFVDPLFVSNPLAIANQFVAWIGDGTLWFHTSITLQETLLGLISGVASGILVGFFLGIEQTLAKLFDPFITAIYSIPKIAL